MKALCLLILTAVCILALAQDRDILNDSLDAVKLNVKKVELCGDGQTFSSLNTEPRFPDGKDVRTKLSEILNAKSYSINLYGSFIVNVIVNCKGEIGCLTFGHDKQNPQSNWIYAIGEIKAAFENLPDCIPGKDKYGQPFNYEFTCRIRFDDGKAKID